jgi:transmembrane sensor
MNPSKYFKLSVRAITGNITLKQKKALDRWLQQSPERQQEYNRWMKTWERQKHTPMPIIPDVDAAWQRFEASLPRVEKKRSFSTLFMNIDQLLANLFELKYRPALVSAAAILIVVMGLFLWKSSLLKSSYNTVMTLNTQTQEVTLSDGTRVLLNSGSRIQYPKTDSATERTVRLVGEAYFSVIPDERPFYVITQHARTTVLGTQFNVWARGEETRVIVKEGLVRLSSLISKSLEVEITKGQMSKVIGQSPPQPPTDVDTHYSLGWLRGQLVFIKTPLSEIVDELQRKFDVSIEFADPSLTHRTMTADFEDATIDEILSSICLTLDIRYMVDKGDYILAR